MTDEHSDGGRAELIAARHQVTTFVEGLLDVLEESPRLSSGVCR